MTEYICNAAGKVAYCAKCLTAKPHECRPLNYFHCSEVGGSVRCDLIEETHTCYYCNHEGADVNRIAKPISKFKERQTVYCCNDGTLCDERWQALETDKEAESLENQIQAVIVEEGLMAPVGDYRQQAKYATHRIMKLLALPFVEIIGNFYENPELIDESPS